MYSEFPIIIRAVPLALVCFVGACGSATADSNSENTAAPVAEAPTPTPTPTPTAAPVPVSGGVYDASIGAGVDADGFAAACRCAAERIVSSSTPPLARTATAARARSSRRALSRPSLPQSHASRTATGDQVLLAEGTSYDQDIGWLAFKQGYSATYPMVISSYDPADPANEAKYGRGDQRNARPVITAVQSQLGNGTYNYYRNQGPRLQSGQRRERRFRLHRQSRLRPHREQHLPLYRRDLRHRRLSGTCRRRKSSSSATIRFTACGTLAGAPAACTWPAMSVRPSRTMSSIIAAGRSAPIATMTRQWAARRCSATLIIFRPTRPAQSFAATSPPTAPATAASRAATRFSPRTCSSTIPPQSGLAAARATMRIARPA